MRRASVLTHRGGRVAIDRAEVSLSIDQVVAHDPVLRHPDKRRVDHLLAMRVVIPGGIAGNLGAFTVFAARAKVQHTHRIKDTALGGLEAIHAQSGNAREMMTDIE